MKNLHTSGVAVGKTGEYNLIHMVLIMINNCIYLPFKSNEIYVQ